MLDTMYALSVDLVCISSTHTYRSCTRKLGNRSTSSHARGSVPSILDVTAVRGNPERLAFEVFSNARPHPRL
jgi:hypothetical protein